MNNSEPITLATVARTAGVSTQTVSRVINGSPHVASQTRQRVQEAVDALGYTPNLSARLLASGKSGIVRIIAPEHLFLGIAETMLAIAESLRRTGLIVSLSPSGTEISNPITPDVTIFIATSYDDIDRALEISESLKIVLVADLEQPPKDVCTVGINGKQGGLLATRHLIEQGHEHIAHITGPLNWIDSNRRLQGYEQAMKEAGLTPVVANAKSWRAESTAECIEKICKINNDITAIFAANDSLALGSINILRDKGIEIGEDVALVGYDNVPDAKWFSPSLSSIHQDYSILGEAISDSVLKLVEGKRAASSNIYPDLIVRQSSLITKK